MGRKLTASEETRLLQDTIRQGHELLKELNAKLRVAKALEPNLVREFEDIAQREIHDLDNNLQRISNQAAAELNQHIEQAKDLILNQIMQGEAVFDRDTGVVTLTFGPGGFRSDVPLPWPDTDHVRS